MEKQYLRRAAEPDRDLLFSWINEPECRNNSLHPEPITKEEHEAWFSKILKSEDAQIYLLVEKDQLMEKDQCVGQARIEMTDGRCRISYSIDKGYRGMGYGKLLLYLTVQAVKQDFPLCRVLSAEVKKENVASQKVFEELSFIQMGEAAAFFRYEAETERLVDLIRPKIVGGGSTAPKQ